MSNAGCRHHFPSILRCCFFRLRPSVAFRSVVSNTVLCKQQNRNRRKYILISNAGGIVIIAYLSHLYPSCLFLQQLFAVPPSVVPILCSESFSQTTGENCRSNCCCRYVVQSYSFLTKNWIFILLIYLRNGCRFIDFKTYM